MKEGLWGWWVGMMGGGNRGRGMMRMELQSRDSKHPLFFHMGGNVISVLYHTHGWAPLGKLST